MNSMNDTLSKGSWEGVYMLGALTQIFFVAHAADRPFLLYERMKSLAFWMV